MDESTWQTGSNYRGMLTHVRSSVSERKLRLLDVAACRLVWRQLHKRSKRALQTFESYLDGVVPAGTMQLAQRGMLDQGHHMFVPPRHDPYSKQIALSAASAAFAAIDPDSARQPALDLIAQTLRAEFPDLPGQSAEAAVTELVRDVMGNPFTPIKWDQEWRTSDTIAMARQMYDSRDFGGMGILADALEEAGCTTPAILEHCRSGGPHVRGCWVVDLILGKQ